jgi:hypothetical protein
MAEAAQPAKEKRTHCKEESQVRRKRIIVYWEFTIDIFGPGYKSISDRRKMRKVLSRKRLREIEQAALLATKAKLPTGFTAKVS